MGGRAWFIVSLEVEVVKEEATYTADCSNAQDLGALVAGIKISFADCVQLEFLALGNGCLQTDVCEAVKVRLVAETCHNLGIVTATLNL